MNNGKLILTLAVTALSQCLIWSWLEFSPLCIICLLPTVIMFLPPAFGRIRGMVAAFLLGAVADWFSHGILGLSSIALLVPAFFRPQLILRIYGEDTLTRNGNLSLKAQGLSKTLSAIMVSNAIFLLISILISGAGVVTFSRCIVTFFVSLAANIPVGLLSNHCICQDDR